MGVARIAFRERVRVELVRTEAALFAYESAMFPRAESAAYESAVNLVKCFKPGGPQALLDQFARFAEAAWQR
jgi:hypothetical protein